MSDDITLEEVIEAAIESRLAEVHTMIPGIVESYDPATELASVRPAVTQRVEKRRGGYELEKMPVIHAVPVAFPQGGGCFMKWPLLKGDHVELRFTQVDHSAYVSSGAPSDPGDDGRHTVSHPVAYPGNTGAIKIGPTAPPGTMVIDAPDEIELGGTGGDSVVTWPELLTLLGGAAFPMGVFAPPVPVPTTKVKAQ